MSKSRIIDPYWDEAALAAARLVAYAAGKKDGRREAAERLQLLPGSEVWEMVTRGNDLQDMIQRADTEAELTTPKDSGGPDGA